MNLWTDSERKWAVEPESKPERALEFESKPEIEEIHLLHNLMSN